MSISASNITFLSPGVAGYYERLHTNRIYTNYCDRFPMHAFISTFGITHSSHSLIRQQRSILAPRGAKMPIEFIFI